jgi:general secretion pathway protein A
LTLLLVGQLPLLSNVERLRGLEERISVKCVLRPFQLEETISYITHRLTAAGSQDPIFAAGALEQIHQLTCGIPRRINRLCDLCLLIGYADALTAVEAEQVLSVSEELITVSPD